MLPTNSSLPLTWLKVSVVYFSLGVLFGFIIGASENLHLSSPHAHTGLLGWLSSAMFGLFYHIRPDANNGRLPLIHFWLHNIGLPIMLAGLFGISDGYNPAIFTPLIVMGSLLVIVGILIFAARILSLKGQPA